MMTKNVNAEIIAVGTELLLGQIANTNAQWLSQQMAAHGINVHFHTVVGDNRSRVEETFKNAQKRSDIIVVTGGLGPTEDDLTREAFQSISHLEMTEHVPSMKKIEAFFQNRGLQMTANNRRQARVFKGATVFDNNVGMAPGMMVSYKGRTWIFLPGVPREMKQMFNDHVGAILDKRVGGGTVIKSKVLRFIGIGESRLAYELDDLIRTQRNPTIAPLAQKDGVVIRLTVKEHSISQADMLLEQTKQHILARVGSFYYGTDDETLERKIVSLLKNQNKRIAAAESLTGGGFYQRLTSVPGASQVCLGGIVCYDPEVKTNIVGVSPLTIQSKGTISRECAAEMAVNVCRIMHADIGISFTGIAGTDSVEGKPPGTVYIGICNKEGDKRIEHCTFSGDRETVRQQSVIKGLEMLFNWIKS